jgi:cell division transport system permease protein
VRRGAAFASLLDEALSGLWRARRVTVVSILQISFSLFLVGLFLLAAENLGGVVDTLREETAVTVFLRPGTDEAAKAGLERIALESKLVATVRRVSAEDARARFARSFGSLAGAAGTLSGNPFPASVELDLLPGAISSAALRPFLANLATSPAVEEVQFDVDWIRRLRGVVRLVAAAGLAAGILLALGAAFTIANVVRLTILLHRDEIEILRLVGAPEILIRGPFLLGGILQGLLGGLAALGLLAVAFRGLLFFVASTENVLLGVFVVRFLSPTTCGLLVLGGVFAGLLGGTIASRRKHV